MVDTVTAVPDALSLARTLIGIREDVDAARIVSWDDVIARAVPNDRDFGAYAHVMQNPRTTAWCGHFQAYLMAVTGRRPPFKKGNDLRSYLWVDSWDDFGTAVQPGQEQPGDILVLQEPHHVTMIVRVTDAHYVCLGGNQGDSVKESNYAKSGIRIRAIRRPPTVSGAITLPTVTVDPSLRPELRVGSLGTDVRELQLLLRVEVDGEFGPDTDAAVRAFQASLGLEVDGVVGPLTWAALLGKSASKPAQPGVLTPALIAKITSLAAASDLAHVSWADRGRAPPGYIKGMAVTFAKVYLDLKATRSAAWVMAEPPAGQAGTDALAWYGVKPAGGAATLRSLFSLLIGLGMRESSGHYYEGRDQSASNTSSDTAEAGLFQQSWNSHVASPEIPKLLAAYSAKPEGFLSIFSEGAFGDSESVGSGDGLRFQLLCKSCPAFAVECAAVGLRVIRQHWGPINRREAEMRPEAEDLLMQVQSTVDALPVGKPIEGEVLPPIKEKDMETQAVVAAVLAALEARGIVPPAPQPQPQVPHGAIDLAVFRPLIEKIFSGQPIGPEDWKPLIPIILPLVFGKIGQPSLPPPAVSSYPLIKFGDAGPYVSELQRLLGIAVTGTFDAATLNAVRTFQTARGILVDGEVGDQTWAALQGKVAAPPVVLTPAHPAPPPILSAAPGIIAKLLSGVGGGSGLTFWLGLAGTVLQAVLNANDLVGAPVGPNSTPTGLGITAVSIGSMLGGLFAKLTAKK